MDLDAGAVASALAEGVKAIQLAKRYSLDSVYLKGEANQRAWRLLVGHVQQYGELPTMDLIKRDVPEFKIPEPGSSGFEPLEWYVAELRYRKRQEDWEKLGPQLGALVKGKQLDQAMSKVREFVRKQDESEIQQNQIVKSIFDLIPRVKQRYLDVKAGKIGVPYPWPSVNEQTLGQEAGDFNGFIGRLGMGKTQCLLVSGQHAWQEAGKKVLFVSPEMKELSLTQRFLAYHLKVAQGQLRRGRLDEFVEAKFFEALDQMRDLDGVWIIGDEYRVTLDLVEAAIDLVDPDAVFIDGAYLVMAEKGLNRQENAEAVADALPALAKRKGKPFTFSTQFNRTAQRNDPDTFTDSAIGLTDAFGQNSDNLFALVQTDDMKADKEMQLKTLKAREDRGGHEIRIRWDWERNDFSEVGSPEDSYADKDYEKYGSTGAPTSGGAQTSSKAEEEDEIPF